MSIDKLKKIMENNKELEHSLEGIEIKRGIEDLASKVGVFAFDNVLKYDFNAYQELGRVTKELHEIADKINDRSSETEEINKYLLALKLRR